MSAPAYNPAAGGPAAIDVQSPSGEREAIIARLLANATRRIRAQQVSVPQVGDQKDAQRYRHLRDSKTLDQWIWDALDHTEGDAYSKGLDAAVDAAIAKERDEVESCAVNTIKEQL